ncbi:MAG: hypothetical protein V3U37_00850 [Nitrospinaceae bacterium]
MNYKIMDPLMGLLAGAVIGTGVFYLVPPGWNIAAGMFAGGVFGMILNFFLMVPLIPLFGAFETMIPLSVIGMLAGMAGGMAATHGETPLPCITVTGAVIGLTVSLVIYFSNLGYLKINDDS